MNKNKSIWQRSMAICLTLLLCLSMMPGAVFANGETNTDDTPATDIAIDEVNFPDANFRSYVSTTFDNDKNNTLSEAEIGAATVINVSNSSVSSLTGIEKFTALTKLDCSDNRLTSLNLSSNTALTYIDCSNNWLTSTDLILPAFSADSKNTTLTTLDCSNNQLSYLNLENYSLAAGNTNGDGTKTGLIANNNVYYGVFEKESDRRVTMPDGFDKSRVDGTPDGVAFNEDNNALTVGNDKTEVTYSYECSNSNTVTFKIKVAAANKNANEAITNIPVYTLQNSAGGWQKSSSTASFTPATAIALDEYTANAYDGVRIDYTQGVSSNGFDKSAKYTIAVPLAACNKNTVSGKISVPTPKNFDKNREYKVEADTGLTTDTNVAVTDDNITFDSVTLTRFRDSSSKDLTGTYDMSFTFCYSEQASSYSGGYYVTKDNVTNTTEAGNEKVTTADIDAKTTTDADGNKTVTATVDETTAEKIIKKAESNNSEEIVIDATNEAAADNKAVTTAETDIPADIIGQISDKSNAYLTIKTVAGEISLNKKALSSIINQIKKISTNENVKFVINTIDNNFNIYKVDLSIKYNNELIKNFDGGIINVTLSLDSTLINKDLKSVFIDNKVYSTVTGAKHKDIINYYKNINTTNYINNTINDGVEKFTRLNNIDETNYLKIIDTKFVDNTYTFTTTHFSTYVIMEASEADAIIRSQVSDSVKNLSIKASSSKTSKGNIKVTLSGSSDEIQAIKDLGYTVKYKYYRSTKKTKNYSARIEKKANTYINTTGKKGTRYYYKARVMVYDTDGNIVAKSNLNQCKYASRIK